MRRWKRRERPGAGRARLLPMVLLCLAALTACGGLYKDAYFAEANGTVLLVRDGKESKIAPSLSVTWDSGRAGRVACRLVDSGGETVKELGVFEAEEGAVRLTGELYPKTGEQVPLQLTILED